MLSCHALHRASQRRHVRLPGENKGGGGAWDWVDTWARKLPDGGVRGAGVEDAAAVQHQHQHAAQQAAVQCRLALYLVWQAGSTGSSSIVGWPDRKRQPACNNLSQQSRNPNQLTCW